MVLSYFFRICSQLIVILLVLSLREIGEDVLGQYGRLLGYYTIFFAFLNFDGSFLVLSRNLKPRHYLSLMLFSRILWMVAIGFLFLRNDIVVVIAILAMTISIEFEHFVNFKSLASRFFGNNEYHRKIFKIKIFFTELLAPLLASLVLFFDIFKYEFSYLLALFMLFTNFFFIHQSLKMLYRHRKNLNSSYFIPPIKAVYAAATKKADSNIFKVLIGQFFGDKLLGSIYPALIFGKFATVTSTFFYVIYFNSKKGANNLNKFIVNNYLLLLLLILTTCLFYTFILEYAMSLIFSWKVAHIYYFSFFLINITIFQKTLLRILYLNHQQINFFSHFLMITLATKVALFMLNFTDPTYPICLSLVMDLLCVFYMHKKINK